MARWTKRLGATKSQSTLLVLYIPSAERTGKKLRARVQSRWARKALEILGRHMGGATAFPRGLGVWRDDARDGRLVWDHPVLIQCYTTEETLEQKSDALRALLVDLGTKTNQGAVGFVIDRVFYEIQFPLEGA
jgi:hypothetical protein